MLQAMFDSAERGDWCEYDANECPCRGRGWMLSDLDTWHACPSARSATTRSFSELTFYSAAIKKEHPMNTALAAVIEKIRKLRALAQSSNVHEAAAAAAAASRLLQEHELAEAEVEAAGQAPTESAARAELPLDEYGNQISAWRNQLAGTLKRMHGCAGWVDRHRNPSTGRIDRQRDVIVGRPSDVATVRYLYAWLTTEIERLAAAQGRGKGRAWAHAFKLGAVVGIREKLEEAAAVTRAAATSSALVVVDRRLAESRALRPSALRPARRPTMSDGSGYHSGKRAGAAIHVGKALATGGGAALALGGRK